jgi:peptidoglycan/xylan/chitin deacetylase (PgdA/CDA1 family)
MFHFHRVSLPADWAGLPNRNFYLSLDFLDGLLGVLIKTGWKIATIDELLARLERGEQDARIVNFSVDDCYRDTFEHTVPVFRKHGVPVTLFVTTGIPDSTFPLHRAGLESIIAGKSSITLKGKKIDVSTSTAKRLWFARIAASWDEGALDRQYQEFCDQNGAEAAKLDEHHAITWEMLETFRDDPLVEIGAHTISHPRISELTAGEALLELAGSRDRLRSRLGVACRHFAFPYGRGRDCGIRDFSLAQKAGFASATTTRKGLVTGHQDVYSLPRNSLGGAYQSMAYVYGVLGGLAGAIAKVLGRV